MFKAKLQAFVIPQEEGNDDAETWMMSDDGERSAHETKHRFECSQAPQHTSGITKRYLLTYAHLWFGDKMRAALLLLG